VVPPAPAARSDAAPVVEATPPAAAASVATTAAPRSTPARVAAKPAAEPTPIPAAVPPPGPRLQAISERDGQPIAMINDHVVRVGDEVDGMRVLAIRIDEVDIEVGGRRTTLRF
jgi:hypothetical protein